MCRNVLPCRGAWSTPWCFLAINESDVRSHPLEGKPWTAVWEHCQRMRNKRLAPVPALLQSLMEPSGVRQVPSSCLMDESTCPNFYCPPTPPAVRIVERSSYLVGKTCSQTDLVGLRRARKKPGLFILHPSQALLAHKGGKRCGQAWDGAQDLPLLSSVYSI